MTPAPGSTMPRHVREVIRTGALRDFSPGELFADRTVHIVGLVVGISAAITLTLIVAIERNWSALVTVVAYSVGLVAMLSFSAAYNLAHRSPHRHILRRLDHAAIFAMIAGTYTPFTILGLERRLADRHDHRVWSLARDRNCGEAFRAGAIGRPAFRPLYLVFGWMGDRRLGRSSHGLSPAVLILLAVGGGLYSIGALFHALQRMPYQNAIWHAFVLTAAMVHYAAVVRWLPAGG